MTFTPNTGLQYATDVELLRDVLLEKYRDQM